MSRQSRAPRPDLGDRVSVLAVSPRFAPTNGADTHRLRLLLRHALAAGWTAKILCVHPEDAGPAPDPWLEENLPSDLAVHRVRAPRLGAWGTNGLAQRAIWRLYRKGIDLLSAERFDLVFFSTTEFPIHLLGPMWLRRFGVPFCMDLQDPWVNNFYRENPGVVPPGGRFKYAMADAIHRLSEKHVIGACSGYLAVSAQYEQDLVARHGSTAADRPWLIRPFPAEPAEYEAAESCHRGRTTDTEGSPPQRTWRYIGRGGDDMATAARAFFMAWSEATSLGVVPPEGIRFEASGTAYGTRGNLAKTILPLATGTAVERFVSEMPHRRGYKETLDSLQASDALVVFGSADSSYTASKIYPYLLARRPLLAIFHERSAVVSLMAKVGGGVCITFDDGTSPRDLAAKILKAWFRAEQYDSVVPLDRSALEPFTAAVQAVEVGQWFREVIANSRH